MLCKDVTSSRWLKATHTWDKYQVSVPGEQIAFPCYHFTLVHCEKCEFGFLRTIHQVCFLMSIFFKRFNTIHLKFLNAISNWKNRVKFSFRLDPKWSHSNVSSVHYLFRMCVLSVCGPIRCCPFALLHIIVISVYYLFLALQQYLCLLGLSGGSINVIKRAKSQRLVA